MLAEHDRFLAEQTKAEGLIAKIVRLAGEERTAAEEAAYEVGFSDGKAEWEAEVEGLRQDREYAARALFDARDERDARYEGLMAVIAAADDYIKVENDYQVKQMIGDGRTDWPAFAKANVALWTYERAKKAAGITKPTPIAYDPPRDGGGADDEGDEASEGIGYRAYTPRRYETELASQRRAEHEARTRGNSDPQIGRTTWRTDEANDDDNLTTWRQEADSAPLGNAQDEALEAWRRAYERMAEDERYGDLTRAEHTAAFEAFAAQVKVREAEDEDPSDDNMGERTWRDVYEEQTGRPWTPGEGDG